MNANNDPESYAGNLEDKINIAIRTALTVCEEKSKSNSKGLDYDAFTPELLVEVSRSIVYHLGFDGEIANVYEDHLTECIAPFDDVEVNEKHLNLLSDVIRAAIEPALTSHSDDYADIMEERGENDDNEDEEEDAEDDEDCDDNGDDLYETELVDQISAEITSSSGRIETKSNVVHITETVTMFKNHTDPINVNEQAEFDAWMEKVMSKSEKEYLEEESDYPDAEPDAKVYEEERFKKSAKDDFLDRDRKRNDSSEDEASEVRRLPQCKNSSSSSSDSASSDSKHLATPTSSSDDDTLHSESSLERRRCAENKASPTSQFQSPEPYQIRKSVRSSKDVNDEAAEAAGGESLPAWLMPKSPLDSHFRKGYGGLGHSDLDEVIAEVTSSQKKALRESKIADDNERESDCNTPSTPTESDTQSDIANDEPDSDALPAWEMPKSPMDVHFRKGYGGLGHADFDEAVEEITTAQKKARQAVRDHVRKVEGKVGRLYSESDEEGVRSSAHAGAMVTDDEYDFLEDNIITIDDLPVGFGTAPTALNPTNVGTPVQVRSSRNSSASKTSSGQNKSRGSEYAKQTKLFQSPNPSQIRVSISSKKSASNSEDPAPAWEIPKSPLDSHFRKGYGGLGHADFQETVEVVTTAQKKAAAKTLALSEKRSGEGDDDNVIKMLEHYFAGGKNANKNEKNGQTSSTNHPSGKRKNSTFTATTAATKTKPSPKTAKSKAGARMHTGMSGRKTTKASSNAKTKPKTRVAARKSKVLPSLADEGGEASGSIMFDPDSEGDSDAPNPYSFIDAHGDRVVSGLDEHGEHVHPAAHPATEPPTDGEGNLKLTGNKTIDDMIRNAYLDHIAQYKADAQAHVAHVEADIKHQQKAQNTQLEADVSDSEERDGVEKSPVTGENHRDLAKFLNSPHLQHSMDQIDEMIRTNLNKLGKMKSKEKALRDSISLSLTDHSVEGPKRKVRAKKTYNKKLTRRSQSYLIAPTAANKASAPAKNMTRCKSTTTLHLRPTGNLKNAACAVPLTDPRVRSTPSRRSSQSTAPVMPVASDHKQYTSKISAQLLSLHNKATTSSSARAESPRLKRPISSDFPAALRSTTPPVVHSRPLSPNSRLLAPTVSALIRAADIATNSSKAANMHNEWHLQLRSGEDGATNIELSGPKSKAQLIRRSLPAADVDRIIEWNSPDKKSRSMDFSLGIKNHALCVLDNSALTGPSPFSTPTRSPRRKANADAAVNIPSLARESRLTAPTVATVMRSLDTAQHSPVIKRLQTELSMQPSKAYLFRGPKFAKNLAAFQSTPPKRKRKAKKTRKGTSTKGKKRSVAAAANARE